MTIVLVRGCLGSFEMLSLKGTVYFQLVKQVKFYICIIVKYYKIRGIKSEHPKSILQIRVLSFKKSTSLEICPISFYLKCL